MTPFELFRDKDYPTENKRVFAIMAQEQRSIYEDCIRPACEAQQLKCSSRFDPENLSGDPTRIWAELQQAQMIVADITGLDADVLCEVGIAISLREQRYITLLCRDSGNGEGHHPRIPMHLEKLTLFHYTDEALKQLQMKVARQFNEAQHHTERFGQKIQDVKARKLTETARQRTNERDWIGAEALFKAADQQEPDNWYIHMHWGVMYRDQWEYPLAEERLDFAIDCCRLPWEMARAFSEKALLVYRKERDAKKAEGWFRKAAGTNRLDKQVFLSWAKFYEELGEYYSALEKVAHVLGSIDKADEEAMRRFAYYNAKLSDSPFHGSYKDYLKHRRQLKGERSPRPPTTGATLPWAADWDTLQQYSGKVVRGRVKEPHPTFGVFVRLCRDFDGLVPRKSLEDDYEKRFRRNREISVLIEEIGRNPNNNRPRIGLRLIDPRVGTGEPSSSKARPRGDSSGGPDSHGDGATPHYPTKGAQDLFTRPTRGSIEPDGRHRFLQGRFPSSVRLGDHVVLQARIALERGDEHSARLRDFDIPPEGMEVLLVLHSPGFEQAGGNQNRIRVPFDRNSDWVVFELTGIREGVHRLEVSAFAHGGFLGSLTLETSVDSLIATGDNQEKRASVQERQGEEGDYILEVNYDDEKQVYSFRLIDYFLSLSEQTMSPRLKKTPQEAVEELIKGLNGMPQGRIPYDAEETREWLRGHGEVLWKEFIPEALQRQFWECQSQIQRLLIVAKGDPVPWELLYPHLAGTNNDAGFLAEQFPIGRWRHGQGPASRLHFTRADFVEPKSSLSKARQEIEVIQQIVAAEGVETRRPICDLSDLRRLLLEGGSSLLHFACHNTFDSRFPAASTIQMGAKPFQPIFLRSYKLFAAAPLVFINACRSNAEAALYTGLGGWASAFLDAGAGAFIGSLWEVRDETAIIFAEEFYRTLFSGMSVGDAMWAARRAVRGRPGDPTWLAYTLYGDPGARIV